MNGYQSKLNIGLLIALVSFPQISETIYTPALPNVAKDLLASASSVEATLAIYFLGFAAGVLGWGMIADLYGRRPAMLVGIVLYGLGTLGCAGAQSVEVLLAWRFLQALGASVGSVITQTILRDSYQGEARTKLFAILSGALAFSPAIGPVAGGFITEILGWRANFWTLVVFALGLFLWSFLALPETRPGFCKRLSRNELWRLVNDMKTNRFLWGHIILIGGTNGIIFGFYQEAPFLFVDHLHMQPSHYGFFGFLIAAATLIASRVSYRQSARFSAQTLIQSGAVFILVGGSTFTLTVMLGLFEQKIAGTTFTILALFLTFFGIGLIIPNSLSHALRKYQQVAGTAGSLFGGSYYGLIAGLTWLMSMLHSGSPLLLPLYITVLSLAIMMGSLLIAGAQEKELFAGGQ